MPNTMASREYGLYVGGEWVATPASDPVYHKFTGDEIARVARARQPDVDHAMAVAERAFRQTPFHPVQRYEALSLAARLLKERHDEFLATEVAEAGFTRKDVRNEIRRAIDVLTLSAEEARRIGGEVLPIQSAVGFERDFAYTFRVPVGVVCAITPFNAPISTVLHKIAPALAAGNSVVLKPAGTTPLCSLKLAQVLTDAGVPRGYLNVLTGPGRQLGRWLSEHPTPRFYTFTGSTAVGRDIQSRAGLRRTNMELGNISATIVCADADLQKAAPVIIGNSFRKAGQVCTSVQRIYAEAPIVDELSRRLAEQTRRLHVGDPDQDDTDVGPMIDERETVRAEGWVEEALRDGARELVPHERRGPLLHPTILADVAPAAKVMRDEIFAPVVSVAPFREFDEAIALVNNTPYGLQAGVFTRDIERAFAAAQRIEVGGVIINGTSSTRADLMPYGGTKESGFGKEGPKYAVEEMTDVRVVVFRR